MTSFPKRCIFIFWVNRPTRNLRGWKRWVGLVCVPFPLFATFDVCVFMFNVTAMSICKGDNHAESTGSSARHFIIKFFTFSLFKMSVQIKIDMAGMIIYPTLLGLVPSEHFHMKYNGLCRLLKSYELKNAVKMLISLYKICKWNL